MKLVASLSRQAFNEACVALSQEEADIISETYPHMFSPYFTYNARAADALSAPSPGPAKAREPKASPAIDKERVACEVLANLLRHPGVRSEDITVPSLAGVDTKTANRIVRAILEKAADAKEVFFEGTGRGRRYKVATKAEPEVAAE